jgi:hypothetical protein
MGPCLGKSASSPSREELGRARQQRQQRPRRVELERANQSGRQASNGEDVTRAHRPEQQPSNDEDLTRAHQPRQERPRREQQERTQPGQQASNGEDVTRAHPPEQQPPNHEDLPQARQPMQQRSHREELPGTRTGQQASNGDDATQAHQPEQLPCNEEHLTRARQPRQQHPHPEELQRTQPGQQASSGEGSEGLGRARQPGQRRSLRGELQRANRSGQQASSDEGGEHVGRARHLRQRRSRSEESPWVNQSGQQAPSRENLGRTRHTVQPESGLLQTELEARNMQTGRETLAEQQRRVLRELDFLHQLRQVPGDPLLPVDNTALQARLVVERLLLETDTTRPRRALSQPQELEHSRPGRSSALAAPQSRTQGQEIHAPPLSMFSAPPAPPPEPPVVSQSQESESLSHGRLTISALAASQSQPREGVLQLPEEWTFSSLPAPPIEPPAQDPSPQVARPNTPFRRGSSMTATTELSFSPRSSIHGSLETCSPPSAHVRGCRCRRCKPHFYNSEGRLVARSYTSCPQGCRCTRCPAAGRFAAPFY